MTKKYSQKISKLIFLAVVAQNPVLPDLIDNTRHYDNVSSSMEVDEFLSSTEKSIDEQVIKKSLTEQSFDMATLQSYFGEKYFTERLVADKDLWKELKQGWLALHFLKCL